MMRRFLLSSLSVEEAAVRALARPVLPGQEQCSAALQGTAAEAASLPQAPTASASAQPRHQHSCFTHWHPRSQSAASHFGMQTQQQQRRTYSARAWDHLTSLPSTRANLADAFATLAFLPNRASYSAQFTPHGLWLVPKAVMQLRQQQKQQQQQLLRAAGLGAVAAIRRRPATARPPSTPVTTPGAFSETAAAAPAISRAGMASVATHVDDVEDECEADATQPAVMEMATDRTKTWRRLKIKKHKIKKRRKDMRYKTK